MASKSCWNMLEIQTEIQRSIVQQVDFDSSEYKMN
jgi:hypothetical protein